MKKCSYCKEILTKKNKTREHVIPKGFIDLFPEQKIAFTDEKAYVDNNGFVVKDVCDKCNNGYLSELDAYALSVISENFIKEFEEDDVVDFKFDFHKICRWLIKVSYNQSRMHNSNRRWFEKNIDYIKGNIDKTPKCSIFAGLHVDMCPVGEKNDLYYIPLSINEDLKFYENGLFKYGGIQKNKFIENSPLVLDGMYKSFFFRFGSIRFLLLIWDNTISENKIHENETLIETLFPYKIIQENKTIKLERVNDQLTTKLTKIIHGSVGIDIWDNYMLRKFSNMKESRKMINQFMSELPKFEGLDDLVVDDYNKMIKNRSVMDKDI